MTLPSTPNPKTTDHVRRLARITMWMSGMLFSLGVMMLVSGFMLGAMYLPLSAMMLMLSFQNERRAITEDRIAAMKRQLGEA